MVKRRLNWILFYFWIFILNIILSSNLNLNDLMMNFIVKRLIEELNVFFKSVHFISFLFSIEKNWFTFYGETQHLVVDSEYLFHQFHFLNIFFQIEWNLMKSFVADHFWDIFFIIKQVIKKTKFSSYSSQWTLQLMYCFSLSFLKWNRKYNIIKKPFFNMIKFLCWKYFIMIKIHFLFQKEQGFQDLKILIK